MSVNREWLEKDYYAVLGVPKNAPQGEIKKAYRRLAQEHHPDANRGDRQAEERFKEVSAAYDVLGNEQKRKEYDRIRDMGAGGFRFGPGGPGGIRFEDLNVEGDFGDLFGGLFGTRGGRTPRQTRGADLEAEVRVTFDDALRGATVTVRVTGATPCATCGGSGARPGTQVTTCPECAGTGTVAVDQGLFSLARACPRCGGAGRVVEDPCPTCGGSGHTTSTRELRVKVPAGIRDGGRIRLAGRGEAGPPGGRPGDLFVVVRVAPHPHFARKGHNLTLSLPVTYPEAALGAKVRVPTPDGPVTLKIPAGTESGRTFRIRGKGVPRRGAGRGDLLVTVRVSVPAKLTREQKDLLQRLRDTNGESPRAHLGVEEEVKP
ncbi:MAG TPA: molecular chaperone DnaJ [Actinomycetota bacterium]|jgi:molecular chaperone DnaJ